MTALLESIAARDAASPPNAGARLKHDTMLAQRIRELEAEQAALKAADPARVAADMLADLPPWPGYEVSQGAAEYLARLGWRKI